MEWLYWTAAGAAGGFGLGLLTDLAIYANDGTFHPPYELTHDLPPFQFNKNMYVGLAAVYTGIGAVIGSSLYTASLIDSISDLASLL